MAKMNPEVKARWVAALRSGEYAQGKDVLRDGDKFCCLGVLCNLHAQSHPQIAAQQRSRRFYMGASAVLPAEVAMWADLEDRGKVLVTIEQRATLPHHNDHGISFAQIADAIEAQL